MWSSLRVRNSWGRGPLDILSWVLPLGTPQDPHGKESRKKSPHSSGTGREKVTTVKYTQALFIKKAYSPRKKPS